MTLSSPSPLPSQAMTASQVQVLPAPELSNLELCNLVKQPQWLPLLAEWHHQQWPTDSLASRKQKLHTHIQAQQQGQTLPLTLLLLRNDELVGSASLVRYQRVGGLPSRPWLCNVFVEKAWRQQGYGCLLVQAAQRLATKRGYSELYLITTDKEGFYQSLGWHSLHKKTLQGQSSTIMQWSAETEA